MEKGQGKLIEIPWERNKVYFHPSWDLESDYAAEEQFSTDLAMIQYKIRNTDDNFPQMARPPFEYYLSCEIIQILKIIFQLSNIFPAMVIESITYVNKRPLSQIRIMYIY